MPKHAAALPLSLNYQQLLRLLSDAAMTVIQRVWAESRPRGTVAPAITFDRVTRDFAVLSAIVRRSVVVSRELARRPQTAEERDGRVMAALDRVFVVFAAHKIDADAFHAAMDAEIVGDLDEIDDDEMMGFEPANDTLAIRRENADVPGRPPAALVAELCRDLGAVMQALPAEWLAGVPADLRSLCARAVTAALRPSGKPGRVGHLMER